MFSHGFLVCICMKDHPGVIYRIDLKMHEGLVRNKKTFPKCLFVCMRKSFNARKSKLNFDLLVTRRYCCFLLCAGIFLLPSFSFLSHFLPDPFRSFFRIILFHIIFLSSCRSSHLIVMNSVLYPFNSSFIISFCVSKQII